MIASDFWRGRRVLVTGHTGFKGGWLALWLDRLGARVTGLALEPPTEPSLFAVARVATGIDSRIGDIRSFDTVRSAFEAARPEIVFHLAAQPIVRTSYEDPVGTYATNVMGTVHVLEAARLAPSVRALVNVTSDKCYENPGWHWGCREIDPMGGHDPYSSSKGCAELVASAYRRSYFAEGIASAGARRMAVASVRAGNVFGGGDWARDRLLPDLFRAIADDQPLVVRNPDATRPWQHVLEPLSAYMQLAERLIGEPAKFEGAWNFGPREEDAQSVASVVGQLCRTYGAPARWVATPAAGAPHEAKFLHLDITKARRELGYEPRWRLAAGLEATARWYKAFLNGADMRGLSLEQIGQFETTPVPGSAGQDMGQDTAQDTARYVTGAT